MEFGAWIACVLITGTYRHKQPAGVEVQDKHAGFVA